MGILGALFLSLFLIAIIVLIVIVIVNQRRQTSAPIDHRSTIMEASDKIVGAINAEGNQSQILLSQITAGLDVNVLPLSGTVQSQLETLIGSALSTAQPLQVDVQNFSAMQSFVEAALSYAATNLQFDVLASQNGTWTVDLSAATISAIQSAFQAALGAVTVSVDVTTSPVIVSLTGANLSALEDVNVNVAGQPISVTLPGPIALDAATINSIASAVAGQTLTVNVAGQPLSITGTVNLGDVSALTNWFTANNLNINDTAIINAINAISLVNNDITDDDIHVALSTAVDAGCDVGMTRWHTFYERRYDELGNLTSNTQQWTNGVTLTATNPGGLSSSNCPTGSGSGGGGGSVVGTCVAFGGGGDETLPVAPGTMGRLKYIGDHGGGVVRVAFDGTSPVTDSYPEFNARHTLNIDGIDLSMLVFNGTAGNSDYTVCYEVYI